jgi:dienelactone hydrolase
MVALFCLAVFLVGYRAASQAASLQTLPANWAGAILRADGTSQPILVHMTDSKGTLTVQPKTATQPITDVRRRDTTLEFSVGGQRFLGQFDGAQLTGEVRQAGTTDSFILLPVLDIPDAALSEWVGVYRYADGGALGIQLAPTFEASGLDFFWHGLTLNDFDTGAVRGLYPIAKDVFLVGSARVAGYPFSAQVTFERDAQGNLSGLRWQTREPLTGHLSDARRAVPVPLRYETVRYASADGVRLTGLLTLPAATGPHPATVVLPGSERGTRDDFGRQQISMFLASRGLAVLTYDKRGVGDSGGVYQEFASEANLTLLAHDALAGVGYLKGRPEIDGQHIGLMGASQAGWVIPLAARSNDVGFFVILSGPVVSVGIEDKYSRYTNDGASARPYTAEQLSRLLVNVPPSGFDPLPTLTDLAQPGLWLWGGLDKSVPVPESLDNLKKRVANGRTNFTYHVFGNADHNLQQSTQGLFDEIPYSPGFPEDYYPVLADWLQQQIKG